MQSSLHLNDHYTPIGPVTRAKQQRLLKAYVLLWGIGAVISFIAPTQAMQTFGLGLILPGLGFLPNLLSHFDVVSILAFSTGIAAFMASLTIWFATGNVILPCVTWGALALLAMLFAAEPIPPQVPLLPIAMFISIGLHRAVTARKAETRRDTLNTSRSTYQSPAERLTPAPNELTDADLACLRLLLDRALQPVEEFNGFDALDQFQTAALRYQLNFTSYALSMVQATALPAFKGYMFEAQSNLNAKQENPTVWGYWKLENIWGNFDTNGDPFARDNIMYSGFLAAQLLYQRKAVTYPIDDVDLTVTCKGKSGQTYKYTIHEIIEGLVAQYKRADFGLLPCEPNWVFPLCNAITATAIRAYDATYGTTYWADIAPDFSAHLEAEFIDSKGQFIPFRSSYTGFAPPAIGGAVMQSFPCLFFNAVLPDLAKRQWATMQVNRDGRDWKSVIWPVDVGNYGFSRAAGYTATAAAAKEMGDMPTAEDLVTALEHDLPCRVMDGIAHRPNASIWAHANEMLSRVLQQDALKTLVTAPMRTTTPYLKSAHYPDVLVAKAMWKDDILTCALVPSAAQITTPLTFAGLTPKALYAISQTEGAADANGELSLTVHLTRRTTVTLTALK